MVLTIDDVLKQLLDRVDRLEAARTTPVTPQLMLCQQPAASIDMAPVIDAINKLNEEIDSVGEVIFNKLGIQGSTSRLIPLDGLEKVPILLNIHHDGWSVWRTRLLEFFRHHRNAIKHLQGKAGSTYKEALDTELAMIVLLTVSTTVRHQLLLPVLGKGTWKASEIVPALINAFQNCGCSVTSFWS